MHLPPQAYTKETLIQAYNWLRSQPAHIQELAKSPDALVALYSKAQLHGETYLSRSNLQSFKAELKNLAQIMGEEGEGAGASATSQGASSHQTLQNKKSAKSGRTSAAGAGVTSSPLGGPLAEASQGLLDDEIFKEVEEVSSVENPVQSRGASTPVVRKPTTPAASAMPSFSSGGGLPDVSLSLLNSVAAASTPDLKSVLDSRSWAMLQEVKTHFNLSSENEAVRLLIAMGYQKMRTQF